MPPHNLIDLIRLLETNGVSVPPAVRESGHLTDFAVEARYPGLSEPVTEEEYAEAVRRAENVVTWAAEQLAA